MPASEIPYMYVAVVTGDDDSYRSKRPDNSYAAFVGPSRDLVIRQALAARKKWGGDIYKVLVGELTSEVKEPIKYELVPL